MMFPYFSTGRKKVLHRLINIHNYVKVLKCFLNNCYKTISFLGNNSGVVVELSICTSRSLTRSHALITLLSILCSCGLPKCNK